MARRSADERFSLSMRLARLLVLALAACGVRATPDKPTSGSRDYEGLHRRKRALVYPQPSTLLLIFGLGTPLQLERESVIVGAFAKLVYALPTNASEPGLVRGTRSRWSLYRALARLLQLYQLGEGKACVLRAICEAAGAPFDHRGGLLHQLLQLFLSPSSSGERHEEYQDREYEAAERLGSRAADSCHALYPECRRSFLDVFSALR